MLLRLFNSKSVYSAILIPLVAFLFWMEPLNNPGSFVVIQGEGMMPLYHYFAHFFSDSRLLPVLVGFVLVMLNALSLAMLSYEFQFLQHRTFLPGTIYVSVVSAFPSLQTFHPSFPATLFVLLSVYYIFLTYHRKNEISSTFNASFLLSIGTLFYLPVVTLFPLIWISIFVLQKSDNWRLLVIPLIGIALPWLLLWSFLYISGSDHAILSTIREGMKAVNNKFIYQADFLVLTGMIFLLSSFGSIFLVNSVSIRKMSTRKYFVILYWMLGLSLPAVFLFSSTGLGVIALTTITISFLVSHFFMSGKRGFWREFLFLLFIAVLAAIHLRFFDYLSV